MYFKTSSTRNLNRAQISIQ